MRWCSRRQPEGLSSEIGEAEAQTAAGELEALEGIRASVAQKAGHD